MPDREKGNRVVFQSTETGASPDDLDHVPGELPRSHIVDRLRMQREQFRHDNILSPLAPSPELPTEITATSGESVGVVAAVVYYTTDGSLPHLQAQRLPMAPSLVRWDVHAGLVTHWCAAIPPQPVGTVVRYRIAGWQTGPDQLHDAAPDVWAHDGQGFWFRFPGDAGITTFAYRVEPHDDPLPSWVRASIVYQIFPDRFHPGTPDGQWPAGMGANDLHGGTLRGVEQALPYLDDLGVTCLWFTPVTASPSYHRYDTTDYFTVDPVLGTNEDLRALVQAAHARDIRILLDFVPSHVSWEHPAFRAAQRDASSSTASWFTFEERPDGYRMFAGLVPSMPMIDSRDDAARAHLLRAAVQWLQEYEVDGFRIDHAIGVGMDFYVALRTVMRGVRPDAFTVGEAVDSPDCLRRYRGRLDALLDFPLSRALRQTFAAEQWDVRRFATFLTAYHDYMREGPGLLSFLDNHDLNRFLFEAGGEIDRLKLAALCQFTLRPTPIIYYGTEIGLSQDIDKEAAGYGGDAQVRRNMPWDPAAQNLELRDWYRQLIQLRRQHPILWSGSYRTHHVDPAEKTFSYLRTSSQSSPERIVAAFNLGDTAAVLPLPEGDSSWQLLLSTRDGVRIAGAHLHLPAHAGSVLG